MPETDSWESRVVTDVKFAAETLLQTGSITPMFIIRCGDDKVRVIATPFTSEAEKQETYTAIQLICIAFDAVGFSFIGEAWIRIMERIDGESDAELDERTFAQHPSEAADRKEVVTVSTVYRNDDGERISIVKVNEIIRDNAGKVTEVVPIDLPSSGGELSGAMIEILSQQRPTEAERASALKVLESINLSKV